MGKGEMKARRWWSVCVMTVVTLHITIIIIFIVIIIVIIINY